MISSLEILDKRPLLQVNETVVKFPNRTRVEKSHDIFKAK
jgi:hypothetical protein